MNSKIELRAYSKKLRHSLQIDKKSIILTDILRENPEYNNAKNVLLYYPLPNEVNVLMLMSDNKNFYLPRVEGENIVVCPYKTGDILKKSNFNVYEPLNESVNPEIIDLAIIPALMADSKGYRLGYGGGFYDRFLAKYKKYFKTVVLIPKELYVEQLPTENFDIPVDIVLKG